MFYHISAQKNNNAYLKEQNLKESIENAKGVLHGFTMFYHISAQKNNHVYLKEQKRA